MAHSGGWNASRTHSAPAQPCVALFHHLYDFLRGSWLYAGKQIGGHLTSIQPAVLVELALVEQLAVTPGHH